MADKTDEQRLIDIKALLKKTRKGQTYTLSDCADVWGVTKPRFVIKRKEMNFPEHIDTKNNAHIFDRRAALKAMKELLERHKDAGEQKAEELTELVGAPDLMQAMPQGNWSIAELAKANQLRTQFQQDAIDQEQLMRRDEMERDMGAVFSELSQSIADLPNAIDPHGDLPPKKKKMVEKNGQEWLLGIHRRLKRYLSQDAVDGGTDTAAQGAIKRKVSRKSS